MMDLITGINDHNRRLDRILRKALPDYSLSLIHRLLRQGKILVDSRPAEPQTRVPSGSVITIPDSKIPNGIAPFSPAGRKQAVPGKQKSVKLSSAAALDILFQGDGLLILNKPVGVTVHGPDSLDTRVQEYLAEHSPQIASGSISFKPGPLHRLDKPSSGVIAFSTSLAGAQHFSALMREGRIKRYYLAIVEGRLTKAEVWQDRLEKKMQGAVLTRKDAKMERSQSCVFAETRVKPFAYSQTAPGAFLNTNKYTLILAELKTGRTHQIRAQAFAHGHPLAGDIKYGGHRLNTVKGFYLHAWKLIIDDDTEVFAPLPYIFAEQIRFLFGKVLGI